MKGDINVPLPPDSCPRMLRIAASSSTIKIFVISMSSLGVPSDTSSTTLVISQTEMGLAINSRMPPAPAFPFMAGALDPEERMIGISGRMFKS